tara:strand:- start:81 stop:302 length:222 start_codon:yes stop_codon:yes gene_type:complete
MSDDVIIGGKKISKELVEVLIERIQAMPSDTKLAVLGEIKNKSDIIKAIRDRTPFGLRVLAIEAEYYNDLIRD